MIADKLKELAAAKAKVARLEAAVSVKLQGDLAALPARYGFDDVPAFLKAVKSAAGSRADRGLGAAKKGATGKRRKRGVITDATRARVKALVESGESGSRIAKSLKISGQSVHNIKKALGMVKVRK